MDETVLVTGGAGFIGSSLVSRLVDRGAEVIVFDDGSRDSGGLDAQVDGEVEYVRGDIRDRAALEALPTVDRVYHLAAINGTKHFYDRPHAVLDVNVTGVQNVVAYCRDRDVERLAFTSSSEVYGFPRSFPTSEDHVLQIMDPENARYSYAASKVVGESIVVNGAREGGYDYTILRPHNVYGPRMGYDHVIPEFVEQIVTDREFTIYGDGEQTRSFCYISDAIDAIVAASTQPAGADEIFNVGNGDEEVTIDELAEALFDVAGEYPEVSYVTDKELEGSPRRRCPDVSKATELLGYEPTVPLSEGLGETYEWYAADLEEA
jgi:dTDP-glucose 4,6-dehydratase/UDP-glucose 4-epimerase